MLHKDGDFVRNSKQDSEWSAEFNGATFLNTEYCYCLQVSLGRLYSPRFPFLPTEAFIMMTMAGTPVPQPPQMQHIMKPENAATHITVRLVVL